MRSKPLLPDQRSPWRITGVGAGVILASRRGMALGVSYGHDFDIRPMNRHTSSNAGCKLRQPGELAVQRYRQSTRSTHLDFILSHSSLICLSPIRLTKSPSRLSR